MTLDAARPAATSDVDAIVALAVELRAELAPMRGGSVWARREAPIRQDATAYLELLASADAHVVVGTFDGAVIGFAIAFVERLHDDSRLGVIRELFVTPEARGVGVGEQMLGLLLAWSEEHGCIGVDALALPGHRAAKNFFEGAGLTARALVMHRAFETRTTE